MNGIRNTDNRYSRHMDIDTHLQRHPLYDIMANSKDIATNKTLMWMLRVVALPDTTHIESVCQLCSKDYTDIVVHILTECPALYLEHNRLWDYTNDSFEVQISVTLLHLTNDQFVDFLCGQPGPDIVDKIEQSQMTGIQGHLAIHGANPRCI